MRSSSAGGEGERQERKERTSSLGEVAGTLCANASGTHCPVGAYRCPLQRD